MEAFGEKILGPKIGVKVLDRKCVKRKQSVKRFKVGKLGWKIPRWKIGAKTQNWVLGQKIGMKNCIIRKMEKKFCRWKNSKLEN